ncbi:MAG: outer membrane beta-barrel protein [Nevskiaceae bacterium]
MRCTTTLASAALIAALLMPAAASAEVTLGANLGSARVDGGDFEGSDTGWKIHLGSTFEQFLGGEIGYINFGNLGGDGPRAEAWTPAITAGFPIGMARLYGKGGVAFFDAEGTALTEEYKDNDPFFGVGLRVGLSPGLGFRAEYERYRFDTEDIDVAQAGLELNF